MVKAPNKASKVMHVITGLDVGGAEMVLYRLLSSIEQKENAIVVSLTSNGKVGKMLQEKGFTVCALGLSRNPLSFFRLLKLNKLLNQYQPTVVQTWLYAADLLAGLIAKLKSYPVIWNVRQAQTKWIASQWHIGLNQRVNAALSNVLPTLIIYCADAAKQAHQGLGYSKKASRSVVINNGIDTDKFKPNAQLRQQLRQQWLVDDKTTVIGIVGRYDVLKNQHRFLRVFKQLSDNSDQPLLAIMVGRGIDKDNSVLWHDIQSLGLQDSCLLLSEQANIHELMTGFDMHLLTSDNEGWPNVLAEAMSVGLPCVSTQVSDVTQIMGGQEFIATIDDEQVLVQACQTILAMNETQRQNLGMQNRQRIVDNYSLQKTIDDYMHVYQQYA